MLAPQLACISGGARASRWPTCGESGMAHCLNRRCFQTASLWLPRLPKLAAPLRQPQLRRTREVTEFSNSSPRCPTHRGGHESAVDNAGQGVPQLVLLSLALQGAGAGWIEAEMNEAHSRSTCTQQGRCERAMQRRCAGRPQHGLNAHMAVNAAGTACSLTGSTRADSPK